MRVLARSLLLAAAIGCTAPAAISSASTAGASVPAANAAQSTASPPTAGGLAQDGQSGRYLLGGTWLYRADRQDLGLEQGWWQDTASSAGWNPVTVPNAYNARDFSTASMAGWVGWYRRDFTLPTGAFASYVPARDQAWILGFESVNYYATVWLNGHELGAHAGAYLPFEIDLRWLAPGVNRLIVRVDNRLSPTTLPPSDTGGNWWNFGGILGEVYLRSVQVAGISQVLVRPLLECPNCASTIQEQAEIRNVTGSAQQVSLRGAYGSQSLNFGSAKIAPHATWTATASVRVAHPHLWSPGDPYLYRATLTLTDSKARPIGGYVVESGIRTVTVNASGELELNGRRVHLRGVNLEQQNLVTGAALDPAQGAQLIDWARELGATVIRAHYPLSPEIEQLADRDGILIWSEVPVFQVADKYLEQPSWLAFANGMLEQNILDNEDHPSVLLWSIGNELSTPASEQETSYIAEAVALAHRLDPTRPVGMAVSGWPGVACQAAYAPLQVIGYNDYFGWYDAGGGSTDDRDGLGPYLDSLRACYPHQALFVTEFGFEANRDGPVEVHGTYQFQSNAAAFHLDVFATKRWLSGALYFALQDFAVEPGWSGGDPQPDPPFDQKGLIGVDGSLKPAFSVVDRIFHDTVQIAGH